MPDTLFNYIFAVHVACLLLSRDLNCGYDIVSENHTFRPMKQCKIDKNRKLDF